MGLLAAALLLGSCGSGAGLPFADAGPDQTVQLGTVVSVDGYRSRAVFPDSQLAYSWTIVARPNGSTAGFIDLFEDELSVVLVSVQMTTTFAPDLAGSYTLGLVVTETTRDGKTLMSPKDLMTITVTP
jgi:hypothetical protein